MRRWPICSAAAPPGRGRRARVAPHARLLGLPYIQGGRRASRRRQTTASSRAAARATGRSGGPGHRLHAEAASVAGRPRRCCSGDARGDRRPSSQRLARRRGGARDVHRRADPRPRADGHHRIAKVLDTGCSGRARGRDPRAGRGGRGHRQPVPRLLHARRSAAGRARGGAAPPAGVDRRRRGALSDATTGLWRRHKRAIAVAAVDDRLRRARFSNYGWWVDAAARPSTS
jgi:hypothetical protein